MQNAPSPSPAPQWVQPWGPPPYRQPPAGAWAPPRPRPAPKPAPFRPKELGAVLAIALACDVALYGTGGLAAGGYGLALLFGAVPIAMVVATRARRLTTRTAVVAAMLAVVALRSAYAPTAGTVLAGLGLLFAFAMTLRARRVFVPDALASALAAVGKLPSRLGAATTGLRSLVARTPIGKASVLPVVVPLALCAVFAGVFALANPLVAHGLGVAWDAFGRVIGFPSPSRVLVWAVAIAGAVALLRPTVRLARGSESAEAIADAAPVALAIARNALVMLNLLFLAYNALDAAYLWSGSPPEGMRTQQYAHAGAFWLTIALVMLTAVVGVMFRGALAHDPRACRARILAYAWCAQGAILAAGTYRRIGIHIAKSGLSDLRIVGILGTTLVATGVVLVAWKLRERRTFRWLVRRQLDAFALTAALYVVFPTHLVSAHVNVARIRAGEYRPAMHLFRQATSEESIAAVVPLLDHPDVRIRQGVAALLDEQRERRRADANASWRERSFADTRALAVLDAAGPKIAATLGSVDRRAARRALFEVTRVANEDRSLEEILAVPSAADRGANENARDYVQ